jgi:hypothetical protein
MFVRCLNAIERPSIRVLALLTVVSFFAMMSYGLVVPGGGMWIHNALMGSLILGASAIFATISTIEFAKDCHGAANKLSKSLVVHDDVTFTLFVVVLLVACRAGGLVWHRWMDPSGTHGWQPDAGWLSTFAFFALVSGWVVAMCQLLFLRMIIGAAAYTQRSWCRFANASG